MAAITPSTNLFLLKNPNNLSNENQLTFANATAQYNYFSSLQKLEVTDFTYQRKDYSVRYPGCVDDIINYNYVMYQNEAYTDKWYYAYIKQMRWVNDRVTDIIIETDPFQTFMFDLVYKATFVEREHVNNDTIGLHTIPEGLETGEYIAGDRTDTNFGNAHPVLMVTEYCQLTSTSDTGGYDMKDKTKLHQAGGTLGGVYQGCMFLLCGNDRAVQDLLYAYADAGKLDAIVGLFMAPDMLTGYADPALSSSTMWYYTTWSGGLAYGPFLYLPFYNGITNNMGIFNIGKPYNGIDGVTPKNNKLYTYPYIYLLGTNNTGIENIYHYEYFHDTIEDEGIWEGYCRFQTHGVITPGCSIKTVPLYYKNTNYNYSEGMPLGKYPICSYTGDMYTNWLTQNGVNIAISLVSSGLQVAAGGVLSASGAGALAGAGQIASGITGIASTLGSIYEHSLIPPHAQGDVNTGDINFVRTGNNFSFYKMNIKAEMVNVIDNFFSMYGYKVNTVKIPNTTGRTNWNYVKTINANIEGLIPEFYLDEIKNMFNYGVTLWHNPNTFLDYSQTNNIV